MSEQEAEVESVEIPRHDGNAAFSALMDALAPETPGVEGGAQAETPTAGEGTAAPAAGGTDSKPVAGDPGTGGAAATAAEGAGAPATTVPGTGAADAGDSGGADGGRPAAWTDSADTIVPLLGDLTGAFEEKVAKGYHEEALEEVRTEYSKYFEQLEKHPRLLVGLVVPAVGREGDEKLQSTEDAREWQEAVKSILVEEVKGRAQKSLDDSGDFLNTVHSSIELFTANKDLIPGTKDFDVELANRFVDFASDYEVRNDEKKLIGYSIPVQGMIDRLRKSLVAERAAAPTAPAAAAKVEPAAEGSGGASPGASSSTSSPPADGPQAGLQSKAGEGAQGEDFSTLWGTLGLPNMPI